jgi:hypothetical protein
MLLGAFCALVCLLPHQPVGNQLEVKSATPQPIQATSSVFQFGKVTSYYVDDTDPRQGADVRWLLAHGDKVIAGIAPNHPKLRFRGALNAQEWYPYVDGQLSWPLTPPPAAAYILQGKVHLGGTFGATRSEQFKLYRAALKRKPRVILFYNGN